MNLKRHDHRRQRALLSVTVLAGLLLLGSCGSETTEPTAAELELAPASLDLADGREGTIEVRNVGGRPIGPLELSAGPVINGDGSQIPAARVVLDPAEISTLNPGNAVTVSITVLLPSSLQPGDYSAQIQGAVGARVVGVVGVSFTVVPPPPPGLVFELTITGGPSQPRQGDVVLYAAEARDSIGDLVSDPTIAWAVEPGSAGLFEAGGRFVGYEPGGARVIVTNADRLADTLDITIQERGSTGNLAVTGQGVVSTRFTSDLWVHGSHAYTGTWSCRGGSNCGDRVLAWDISDPANPSLTDSVIVDARTVNDVKVRSDGTLAVITHEFSSDGLHGVTLLDLTDPAHPVPIRRFTEGLESSAGIHNVWIEGDYLYAVLDDVGNGLRIVDISTPSDPQVVASFYAGSSFLHDVYVRDGLAFLSHWNAGLIILDVGNGIAGGSPVNPVEVSRIQTTGGQTHNAWYWPDGGYVFVGEEDFSVVPGVLHVVDVRDLENPREVATFGVPGDTPHNHWLDEERGVLYVGWYSNGIRALDVTGELLGELDRQGRELFALDYGDGSGCFGGQGTCTWAPQLHDGLVFAADLNTGLWVFQPSF